jgi:hypothetical protein
VDKNKRSLGRDVFSGTPDEKRSETVKKILERRVQSEPPGAKQVDVTVKLTPSNIKHLDALATELERAGKGQFTRDELIRVAITLLSVGDF